MVQIAEPAENYTVHQIILGSETKPEPHVYILRGRMEAIFDDVDLANATKEDLERLLPKIPDHFMGDLERDQLKYLKEIVIIRASIFNPAMLYERDGRPDMFRHGDTIQQIAVYELRGRYRQLESEPDFLLQQDGPVRRV